MFCKFFVTSLGAPPSVCVPLVCVRWHMLCYRCVTHPLSASDYKLTSSNVSQVYGGKRAAKFNYLQSLGVFQVKNNAGILAKTTAV